MLQAPGKRRFIVCSLYMVDGRTTISPEAEPQQSVHGPSGAVPIPACAYIVPIGEVNARVPGAYYIHSMCMYICMYSVHNSRSTWCEYEGQVWRLPPAAWR